MWYSVGDTLNIYIAIAIAITGATSSNGTLSFDLDQL